MLYDFFLKLWLDMINSIQPNSTIIASETKPIPVPAAE